MIFGMRHKKSKKICERKRASKLEWSGSLEGFQTTIDRRDFMARIHSVRDVCTFHVMVIVWCGKLEPTCSQFCYHAYRRLCFVCFVWKIDDMIFFITSIIFISCFFINIFNWQYFYLTGYGFWTQVKPNWAFCWNTCVEWWPPKRDAAVHR